MIDVFCNASHNLSLFKVIMTRKKGKVKRGDRMPAKAKPQPQSTTMAKVIDASLSSRVKESSKLPIYRLMIDSEKRKAGWLWALISDASDTLLDYELNFLYLLSSILVGARFTGWSKNVGHAFKLCDRHVLRLCQSGLKSMLIFNKKAELFSPTPKQVQKWVRPNTPATVELTPDEQVKSPVTIKLTGGGNNEEAFTLPLKTVQLLSPLILKMKISVEHFLVCRLFNMIRPVKQLQKRIKSVKASKAQDGLHVTYVLDLTNNNKTITNNFQMQNLLWLKLLILLGPILWSNGTTERETNIWCR
jgi:hypothetical protein